MPEITVCPRCKTVVRLGYWHHCAEPHRLPTDADLDELEAEGVDERFIQRWADARFDEFDGTRSLGGQSREDAASAVQPAPPGHPDGDDASDA